ncbi:MAG: hypothetical protein IIA08_08560 [Proteobacteria bacterium]|nr:hypothetical protein [Pseudomonadota bacterium]
MRLDEIPRFIPEARIQGDASAEFISLAYDSRQVEAGGLFVAIRGEKLDGNRFVPDAAKEVAEAVLTRAACTIAASEPI